MSPLSALDLFLLTLYAASLFLPMFRFMRRRADRDEFFVAGRRVTLPAFVASLVSTWYGGILGVGEYTFRYGISNWIVFGVPYYIWAAVFALFMARPAHERRHTSLPDLLHERYGREAGVAGSFLLFITTVPAVYALELGLLLTFVFKISLTTAVLAGTLFTLAYVIYGGLRSVIDTDVIQFVLMFAGFSIMLPVLYLRSGGWAFLVSHLPADLLSWDGGVGLQSILVWYVIASATMIEPGFYQRCYAARSPTTARNGILLSIVFWSIFDFMTTFTGLYARALLPISTTPTMAYPELGTMVLPPLLCGLFFLGMLATIMSTLHGYLFIAGEMLGRDILRMGDANRWQWRTRIGLLVSAALSAWLAIRSQSIVRLWHDLGSLASAALLVPIVAGYWSAKPVSGRAVFASIVCSSVTTLVWLLSKEVTGHFLWGIEPVFPGLLVSAALYLLASRGRP
ncbi:MAG: sodium:solute symporter family protein [Acidobacteria bacterium]|nr:sodium:solute symporter family protein [Acidobacteriota bacterium]